MSDKKHSDKKQNKATKVILSKKDKQKKMKCNGPTGSTGCINPCDITKCFNPCNWTGPTGCFNPCDLTKCLNPCNWTGPTGCFNPCDLTKCLNPCNWFGPTGCFGPSGSFNPCNLNACNPFSALCYFTFPNNICDLLPVCLPKGVWCDTMSCIVQNDKVIKITNEVSVRANLYCSPFVDVVTANGIPVFGCVNFPPLCYSDFINQLFGAMAALACPITKDVYDKIQEYPNLSILLQAINNDPDIVTYLQDPTSTVTLFAPNDTAFESLASDLGITVDQLLANPNMPDILLNNMLPKVVFSAAYKVGQTTQVLARSKEFLDVTKYKQKPFNLSVKSDNSKVANVLEADILATNGTIFIIDQVLIL